MLNEKIKLPVTTDNVLYPKVISMNSSRKRARFKSSCLKQDKVTFTPWNVVNLFIIFELDIWSQDLISVFNLKYCFFRFFKLNKNADPDKYYY